MIIFLNYYLQEASKNSHVHYQENLSIFLEDFIFVETEFDIIRNLPIFIGSKYIHV